MRRVPSEILEMFTARHPIRRTQAAFTLVEVVLAVAIALGILLVLLYFYHQATNLRSQAIQQTETIAAARLVMDRITTDLRAFKPESEWGRTFVGHASSIEFVKTDVPSFAAWSGGTLGRADFPATDLKVVKYWLEPVGLTNGGGLVRSEEPLVRKRATPMVEQAVGTNALPVLEGPPVIEELQHLKFRYWSGRAWLDSWSSAGGPRAVEISLAGEPLTNETTSVEAAVDPEVESDVEVFRRVVCLPEPLLSARQASSTVAEDPQEDATEESEEP
ncbi:MAG: hypothetical protein AB9869_04490 [Verrucomicrobiia bacterium]